MRERSNFRGFSSLGFCVGGGGGRGLERDGWVFGRSVLWD